MARARSTIEALNAEFKDHVRVHEEARRLIAIPGIGVLNATALMAAIGDGNAFGRERDLAAWLGLVPRQVSTGGKAKLLGITKRGNKYLRMLFIHGARAALPSLAKRATPLGQWLRGLLSRAHRNVTVVALAAKLASIAWATLRPIPALPLGFAAADAIPLLPRSSGVELFASLIYMQIVPQLGRSDEPADQAA